VLFPRQHGDPDGHHREGQDGDRDLRRAVGEALIERQTLKMMLANGR